MVEGPGDCVLTLVFTCSGGKLPAHRQKPLIPTDMCMLGCGWVGGVIGIGTWWRVLLLISLKILVDPFSGMQVNYV